MYEVLEVSPGDIHRLFRYPLDRVYGAQFSLKGLAYPWLVSSKSWSSDERVLDVGGTYSDLPVDSADSYGCEEGGMEGCAMTRVAADSIEITYNRWSNTPWAKCAAERPGHCCFDCESWRRGACHERRDPGP